MSMPRDRSTLTAAATLAGLVLVSAGTFQALERATALRATWPPEADTFYLPTASTLRLLSLGHTEAAADLLAARTNVYFGTQLATRGAQRWLSQYVHTAVDLDPRFRRMYSVGPAMLIYNGQEIRTEMVEQAAALLQRGIEMFPLDWELHFQLGFNLLFELPKLAGEDDPRTAKWRQQGVEALRQAALIEGGPAWLPSLVARMLTKQGSDEMALRHLEQAYAVASEEGRRHIRAKMVQLRALQRADQLDEERRRFEEMVQGRYPYAPDAFSVIAGPRQERAVDLPARRGP